MSDYNRELCACAQKAGIDLVGVANRSMIASFKDRLSRFENRESVFSGHSIYDKIDYKKAWPQTKSIIGFAVSYHQPMQKPSDMSERGIVSIHAYGEDYHRVLIRKADAMMDCLRERTGLPFSYQAFVDTGKLSDRIVAYAAGLGFYGKNGFLINEAYGSFLFLGHILLDIELPQNQHFVSSRCGDCEKCFSACPTGALGAALEFTASKCVSYITQKGIDADTYGYLYGCDICQSVCPFNQKAPTGTHREFTADTAFAFPKLDDIIAMDKERFSAVYGQSALAWRGQKALQKNAKQMIKRQNQTHHSEE